MSLYRFKSRETADLVMLEATGKRILDILGKDAGAAGILQPDEFPQALEALRHAVASEEALHQRLKEEAHAQGEPEPQFEAVSLRMRCAPLIDMVQRCQQADVEIVWNA